MRDITAATLAKIGEQYGTEPINIVEVQWNKEGGNYLLYADKDLDLGDQFIKGRVLEISSLEAVLKLDSQNVSQSISVKLSDTDHSLKGIFDTVDIHGSTCRVSQWFPGLSFSDRFKLFEGEISSTIRWDEGDKTLYFDVISKLTDKEVGFSPEEAAFAHIPEELIGVPWPMCFGLVQNVPATRLQEIPTTQLAESTLVPDPTIEPRIRELIELRRFLAGLVDLYASIAASAGFACDFEGDQDACLIEEQYTNLLNQVLLQIAQIDQEIEDLEQILEEQEAEAKAQVDLIDEKNIPQAQSLIFDIEGLEFHGTLSGATFSVDAVLLPEWDGTFDEPFGATFLQAGSTVRIKQQKSITYVANIIQSTVKYVQAYKDIGGSRLLVFVNPALYTVSYETLGVFTVTLITFAIPLSSSDENFEDDIYVTLESDVGPNTVDEMIWLIETYSDMGYDATSFNYVKTKIDNYPSHFAMLERKNLLTVLEEIAFQSRCAIWVNNNTVYLKYLSEELAPDDTISENDIDVGTLQIYGTNTEDLVTKLTARWTDDYAAEDLNKIILRHNIKKYGTRERTIDFYIYNIGELVLKSATFWLIRLANVWKNLRFETSLHKLNLETFDTVSLAFTESDFIASSAVSALVTDLEYESDRQTLLFEVWTPVRFGTMEQYIFSWPSQIDPSNLFPTNEEISSGFAGGDGPGAEVEGGFTVDDPEISVQFNVTNIDSRDRFDYGDTRPSDLDDVKPFPAFVGRTANPGVEPTWQYTYPVYPTPTIQESVEDEKSHSYPGKVLAVSEADSTIYSVEVYEDGLLVAPIVTNVKQLQITGEEPIPADTWVLVAKNTDARNSEGETITEYTMQVPVWL